MTKMFKIWRLLVKVGVASSGCWTNTSEKQEKRTFLLSFHIVEKNCTKALSVIIGPFMATAGILGSNGK